MPAIGAIFAPGGVPKDAVETLLTSLKGVAHDDAATWSNGPMALAAAITHTCAEAHRQVQPYHSPDGQMAAVLDGFLLNPQELTADLLAKGVKLSSHSDVAIALGAYQAWGEQCAERLEGEFSLIVADSYAGRMFVVRDHVGFAPLFFKEGENGGLILASDFRTFAVLSESALEPDPIYLAQVMSNRWYTLNATPWRGVQRMQRASTLSFDGSRIDTKRYWEPPTDITIRYKRDQDYVEHYRELLFDCVRRASRSDRLVGIAVSGGLDSSALFCIADDLEKRGQWHSPGFAGYSLAAEEGGNAFELPYARAASAHVGRALNEVPLFDPDIDWYTADGAWHHDLPIPSNGAMMLDMERRVVEDGGRVLINGSGGDEWLQGNAQYYRELIAERDSRRFFEALRYDGSVLGWASALKQAARQSVAELTPAALRGSIRKRLRARRRRGEREPVWLSRELREALADAEEAYNEVLPENGVLWAKHNLIKTPFSDLSHSMMRRQRDRIGLQSRHPMLSKAFIEFSLRTPAHIKRRGSTSKLVHRETMAGILPKVILNRTTKANFTNTKIDAQFADYVRAYGGERLAEFCDLCGLEKLLEIDFRAPEGDFWAWEIWGLYASAAFLYQTAHATETNPATGVQQDRNRK